MPAPEPATWSGSQGRDRCPCPLAGDFSRSDHDRLIQISGKVDRLDESIPDRLTAITERLIQAEADVAYLQAQIPGRVQQVAELAAEVKTLELTASATAARTALITSAVMLLGTGAVALLVHLWS